jgi:hypothetical protein
MKEKDGTKIIKNKNTKKQEQKKKVDRKKRLNEQRE